MTSGTRGEETDVGDKLTYGFSNGYISFDDGKTFEPLGEITEFDISEEHECNVTDEEMSAWADALLTISGEPQTITFKLPWYSDCQLRQIATILGVSTAFMLSVGAKPKYTIRRLRRGGKSHKGKGLR